MTFSAESRMKLAASLADLALEMRRRVQQGR